ncbi:GolD/DthD family dehydrogenase [Paraburkholderia sp.]|uniref:GolD/DthD family dehydrogenase n=1 Tax=Paraburkholderia sp. TaxID=1926495 RepID=UPI003D701E6D
MATQYDMSLRHGVDFDFRLDGQIAVVTGGLGGIAMATNTVLIGKGARVAVLYPRFEQDRVAAAIETLGAGHAAAFPCDVGDESDVAAAMEAAVAHFGDLHLLVNAAGTITLTAAEDITLEEWRRQIDVNLTGPFLCSKHFARHVFARGHRAKIINIASQAATVAIDKHCAYTSAKAGLIGMTKTLAKEWSRRGITVNTVSPTVVLTPMGAAAWDGEKGERMKDLIPVGRFAYTDEIAAAILFLASNGSDMINGADLMIDGGYTIY